MTVVTLGETMALLSTPPWGRVTGGSALPVGIGGAESNVAIGLARLGVPATWISRVGEDALGELVTREIRAEGVRVLAGTDAEAPTGLMLKELRDGKPRRVRYYRRGSAASRLSRSDIDPGVIQRAGVVHLTGITAALGPGPRDVLRHVIELAHDAGTLVSFDVNHRATLWTDEQARPVLAGQSCPA
ncbi:sugar kinase [Amycolatopsis lurida]